jgi:bifunctional non-homologous end joining protein LigD
MTATIVQRLPEGVDWLYDVKPDGYRALIMKDGPRVQIRSRNEKDLTASYPGVAVAGLRLSTDTAVIDGEIVAVTRKVVRRSRRYSIVPRIRVTPWCFMPSISCI